MSLTGSENARPADQYTILASYYDALNAGVDYKAIAEYCDAAVSRWGLPENSLALDLACGTGGVTLELAKRGYDMIGLDCSEEMLAVAASKRVPAGAKILWLKQDMREFELYGTVGLIVCALDSINYLTDLQSLVRCFALAHNYLDPGGLFVFDVNTKHKFENVLAGRDFVLESDGVLCAWRNTYSARSGLCRFELSIFTDEGGGLWRRLDEVQTERYWSDRRLRGLLAQSGFELCTVTAGYNAAVIRDAVQDDRPLTNTSQSDERHCYIARALK